MYRAITTKVVILGIEYRYRSLSSIEVSSIDVIAGIVLTLAVKPVNYFWQSYLYLLRRLLIFAFILCYSIFCYGCMFALVLLD